MTTETKADIRVIDNFTLKTLNRKAKGLGLSRYVDPEWLDAHLDPEGFSTAHIVIWGHNMDSGTETHHRTMIHAKFTATMEPEVLILDMTDRDWSLLPNAYEVLERAEAKIAAAKA